MEPRTDQIIERIRQWVASAVPDAELALLSPTDTGADGRFEVRMVRMTPQPAPRDGRGTKKLWLDYLVSARLGDPAREQQALAELMFSALDIPEWEVHADVAGLQQTLGLRPDPAFLLRVPLVREGQAREVPLVRFPLRVTAGDMQAFEGRVLGPGDVPVAGALVESAGFQPVRADADGRFRLLGNAGARNTLQLRVSGRGVAAEAEIGPGSPVVVQLPVEN